MVLSSLLCSYFGTSSVLADRLRGNRECFFALLPLPAHWIPVRGLFRSLSAVDEECLCFRRASGADAACSLEMVLDGEPGDGGEFESDDLVEVLADIEKELILRYLVMLTGVLSLGPSRPVFTKSFSLAG